MNIVAKYQYKTAPYAHQREALNRSASKEFFGLPMDMGTGKTKVIIDNAAYLFERGKINSLVVVAPNGVHAQWVDKQVPIHLPDRIQRRAAAWYSQPRVAQKKAWDQARKADPANEWLAVLTFNYEALTTERGKKELWWVLEKSRALLVLDESHRAKSPGATTTKALLAASRRAPYRRILSGTPFDNSPLDAYAQMQFLSPSILDAGTFVAFRARYSMVENVCSGKHCHRAVGDPIPPVCPHCGAKLRRSEVWGEGGVAVYPNVTGYRNLEELRDKIAPHIYRVKKRDCLDLPPKVYETRPVGMSPEQRRLYHELLDEGAAFLRPDGKQWDYSPSQVEKDIWDLWMDPETDKIVAKSALANILRRRQVLGGFIEESGTLRWVDERPPRLKALLDVLQDIDGKVLIWAAFKPEVQMIMKALDPGEQGRAVAYYGGVDVQTRAENKDRFITDPECQYFVGTAAAGGTGVDGLTVASTVIYYSNGLKAGDRWQSEDRAHRIGQHNPVTIIDLVCEDTLDQVILDAFARKRQQSEYLLGDSA